MSDANETEFERRCRQIAAAESAIQGRAPVAPLIPTEQPEREDAFNRPNEALIYASKQVVEGLRKAMEPEGTAPPAVTAKPDLAAPVEQASAEPSDTARMDFIEAHPEIPIRTHKKRWAMIGFTSYEYDVFKTAREAIDAAIARKKS